MRMTRMIRTRSTLALFAITAFLAAAGASGCFAESEEEIADETAAAAKAEPWSKRLIGLWGGKTSILNSRLDGRPVRLGLDRDGLASFAVDWPEDVGPDREIGTWKIVKSTAARADFRVTLSEGVILDGYSDGTRVYLKGWEYDWVLARR